MPWTPHLSSVIPLLLAVGDRYDQIRFKENMPQKLESMKLHFDYKPLTQEVLKADLACTCDDCQPSLYTSKHALKRHLKVDADPPTQITDLKYKVVDPPVLKDYYKYEGMDLARQSIAYFDKPREGMNSKQLSAIAQCKSLYSTWESNLNTEDVSKTVPLDILADFVQCFNDIFFFGAIKNFRCEWFHGDKDPYGLCKGPIKLKWLADEQSTIFIHATDWCKSWGDVPEGRKFSRLSTLLHESAHAFLNFACHSMDCTTFHRNIGYDGHGRAWMWLAHRIEKVAPGMLGFPVYLDRMESHMFYLTQYTTLPSVCDLKRIGAFDQSTIASGIEYPYLEVSKGRVKQVNRPAPPA